MKIFAAGIVTETNTFSPLPIGLEDFLITRGQDAQADEVSLGSFDMSPTWRQLAEARGDRFASSLMAWCEPGGPTVRPAYEALRDEMLRDLEAAMPVDVVLLLLHGAMVADGYPDCEEDILRRVRAIVGARAVVAVELDLHCHLTESKIAAADLIITYKEYPHIDIVDRARELFELAVATRLGKVRPTMALFDCRMVGLYPTSRQPMRGFVDEMIAGEKRPGVLSISLAHGFQFADVAHVGAKALVVTDKDRDLARQIAREFGTRIHALRREVGCESFSLPMDQAFEKALACAKTPVVVADQSDNPGCGAPGDATFALRWLLDHGVGDAVLALLYDPEVVSLARKAGKGARLALRLGGKLSPASGAPVDLEATVQSIQDHCMQRFPQKGGEAQPIHSGDVVALRSGGIDIVVTNKRCQCCDPSMLSELGIDPRARRLIVVKSAQHFYAGFAPIAGEVIYMSAPGAAAPDPRRIPYRRVDTARLYPWAESPL